MRHRRKFRLVEAALLCGVAFSMLFGLSLDAQQVSLREKTLRLHVLAHSNSEEDQALKLKVRDRVLQLAESYYEPEDDRDAAEKKLLAHLDDLEAAGEEIVRANGYSYPVSARIEDTWFPTKTYTDFSFPAGEYRALRVIIGDGKGENWWCVLFPPLCLSSVTEETAQTAAAAGFSEEETALITGESGAYVVRFKCVELWEKWKRIIER